MYNVRNWLKNDYFMFEDVQDIIRVTVQAYWEGTVIVNEGHWMLVGLQYSDGFNNQPLVSGLDYFSLGASFGDIVGRLSVDLYN